MVLEMLLLLVLLEMVLLVFLRMLFVLVMAEKTVLPGTEKQKKRSIA